MAGGNHSAKGASSKRQRGELTSDQLQPGKTYVESTSLAHDILGLFIKIAVIVALFVLLFTLIFGLMRNDGGGMSPAIHDGDMLMYYRLDKEFVAGDVAVIEYEGELQALRVVAVSGDTVDITEEGLLINGSLQSENTIIEDTTPFAEGVTFPITVEQGRIFVLGDARGHATDSRIFGTVDTSDTKGSVIGLLRRRNI